MSFCRFAVQSRNRSGSFGVAFGIVLISLLSACETGEPTREYDLPEDDPNAVWAPSEHDHTQHHEVTQPLVGGPNAHLIGEFAPVHNTWPIMPIATVLMPDGRVFAYGTNGAGQQGALSEYAIWNPAAGTGAGAFTSWANGTHTDIFCAGQALLPGSGDALLVGGEISVNGQINYGQNDVVIYDRSANMLDGGQSMAFNRWYATLLTLPNGQHLVLGGRDSKAYDGGAAPNTPATYSEIPEVRAANGTWRSLPDAGNNFAYGSLGASWNYPRAWVNPSGKVFVLAHSGMTFQLDTAGAGTLTQYAGLNALGSQAPLPSVMYAPGKILSVRNNKAAQLVNLNGGTPTITDGGFLAHDRKYGSATVLANGAVWVNGGNPNGNIADGGVLASEMWTPWTNTWVTMASATKARLYHSVSMLLADATVFTGGGGAPGPYTHLNGEIYYPTYLFESSGSGQLKTRPVITNFPATIDWNQSFTITANENITKLTLVRIGGATHAFNGEARFYAPALTSGSGTTVVTATAPASANVAPPGFYMVFAWNSQNTPSVAKIVRLD